MKTNVVNVKKITAVVIAFLLMILSVSYSGNKSDAANTARTYRIFNAKTGVKIGSDYTLNALPSENNQKRTIGIIDDDNRKIDKKCNGVVYIWGFWGYGSGFIIDDHVIVTAAHCVYSFENNRAKIAQEILIYDDNGSVALRATPVQCHVPLNYINSSNEDLNYDYALITVKEDLSSYPHFKLGIALDSSKNLMVKASGFAKKENDTTIPKNVHVIYNGQGNIVDLSETQILIDADVTQGDSGGPIYIEENIDIAGNKADYKTAIAIITNSYLDQNGNSTCNAGVRFTTDHINFYKANKYVNWE